MQGISWPVEDILILHEKYAELGTQIPEFKGKYSPAAIQLMASRYKLRCSRKGKTLAMKRRPMVKSLDPLTRIIRDIYIRVLSKEHLTDREFPRISEDDFEPLVLYTVQLYKDQGGRCALSGIYLDIPTDVKCSKQLKKQSCISVDRIDSTKPYEIGNIQIVHRDINYMKQSYSQEYFVKLCTLVSENYKEVKSCS